MLKFLILGKIFLYSLAFSRVLNKNLIGFPLIAIMFALLISGFLRNFYGYNRNKVNIITLFMDLILASLFSLISLNSSFDKLFIIYLVEGTAILPKPLLYIYAMLATFSSIGFTIRYELMETGQLQLPGIAEWMYFVFLFFLVFNARKQLEQKLIYEKITKELYYANYLLKESMALNENLAAEAERRRIVGEIHDSLGYSLTGLIVTIEAGKKLVTYDVKTATTYLDKALQVARESLQSIREVVSAKKESDFEFQLTPRLLELNQEVRNLTGLQIKIDINIQDCWLSNIEQFNMYRIFQEAITNTLRHADARYAQISISGSEVLIEFSYRDDGFGTDRIDVGNGLQGMKDRCVEIGSSICFKSQKGCGFEIKGCIDRRGKNNE